MKGISPLVASVLLIAVTMSIAGVLAYWASQFVTKGLPEVNQSTAKCKYSDFVIYSCVYNSSAGGRLFLNLYNIQQVDIKSLVAYLSFSNGTFSSRMFLNESLAPGEIRSYNFTSIPGDFMKVIVTSQLCPDIIKEDTCTRS